MRSESLQALRFFLLAALTPLSAGIEVVQAQDNQVPEPIADNFAIMTLLFRDRLGMNVVSYTDGSDTRFRMKKSTAEKLNKIMRSMLLPPLRRWEPPGGNFNKREYEKQYVGEFDPSRFV